MQEAALESYDLKSFITRLIQMPRVPTNADMLSQASTLFAAGKFDRAQGILNSIGFYCASKPNSEQCLQNQLGDLTSLYVELQSRLPAETKESENADFLKRVTEYVTKSQALFGTDAVVQVVKRKFIAPLLYPKALIRDNALLLYGPPGTGKTKVAEAFPAAFDGSGTSVKLFFVPGGTFRSKWVGATETRIVETYDKLERDASQRKNSLSILFVDEIEAIAGKREQEDLSNIVSTLLQVMQGIKTYPHVITIAATNLPWQLDSAIARRFQNSVMVDLPTKQTRRDIIKNAILTALNANTEPSQSEFQADDLKEVTEYLDNLTWLTGISPQGIEEFKLYSWLPIAPSMKMEDELKVLSPKPGEQRYFGWTHDGIRRLMDDVLSRMWDLKRKANQDVQTFSRADFTQSTQSWLKDSTTEALAQSVNVLDENQYRQLKNYQRYGTPTAPPPPPAEK